MVRENGNEVVELPNGQMVLKSMYHVSHPASNQSYVAPAGMPIVVNKVRTADKARHAAATESLAYFIRGLLAVPRFDPDEDINAEAGVTVDTKPKPLPPKVPGLNPKSGELFMDDEKTDLVRKLIHETDSNEKAILGYYKVANIGLLDSKSFDHLLAVLNDKLVAGNLARETGGEVTKVTPNEPPPDGSFIDTDGTQVLDDQQQRLVRSSLETKKKDEAALLAHFAYPHLGEVPVSLINEVMAWIRS